MSAISSLMKMRAEVTRVNSAIKDTDGLTAAPVGAVPLIYDAMPIYVWIEQDTDHVDGKSVAVERMRGYCRKDADIKRLDIINQIKNRNGDVLFAGPIVVDAVTPKTIGIMPSHFELELRREYGS